MGKTLSEDLRVRVIAAIDGGLARNAAAARFGVAISTAAKPKGGDLRSHRIEAHRAAIFAAVDAKPDITLEELAALLRTEHAALFSPSTICRFFARHSVTFKKKPRTAASRAGRTWRRGGKLGSTSSLT